MGILLTQATQGLLTRVLMENSRSNDDRPGPARRSIFPEGGDDWVAIARREMPGTPTEEAVSLLQSWNLHVFMRPAAAAAEAGDGDGQRSPILPSDIIFVEPPRAKAP